MTHLLPRFTFLNGPKGSGKSSLAEALCESDAQMTRLSFAEPLRNSLLATYWPDELFDVKSIDLREPSQKRRPLPLAGHDGGEVLIRDWLIRYGEFLKIVHGPEALGRLALCRAMELESWYSRFIFDDARLEGDLLPFLKTFPKEESLIVHLSRDGADWSGDVGGMLLNLPCKHIALTNSGTLPDLVFKLHQSLRDPELEKL